MITKKSIKELVELVEEGKLSEIVFEDEIERVKYVIFKNEIGVGIQKTDMDKKEEKVKTYRETILESPSNPILEKAMDYMINPYPKVNDSILEMYKSTLAEELNRINEIKEKVSSEFKVILQNIKVLEDIIKVNGSFKSKREEILKTLEFDLAQRHLALESIQVIKSQINNFIEKGE